MIKMITSQWSN